MRTRVILLLATAILMIPLCAVHATETFADVSGSDGDEVLDNLHLLYESGILHGYPDGTFRGDDLVSRYEMGAVITRIYGYALDEMGRNGVEVCDFVDIRAPVDGPLDMDDIPEGHWAFDEIRRLEHMGVASGFPDGGYMGTKFVTRYEFAAFLLRAVVMIDFGMWEAMPRYTSGLRHSGTYRPTSFSDVPEDHWALGDIRRLYEAGETLDSEGTEFEGEKPFTRYEMAGVLIRLRERFLNELQIALDSSD